MSARKLSLHSFHQLTLDDRILIQTGLEQETRLKDIAGQIGSSLTGLG